MTLSIMIVKDPSSIIAPHNILKVLVIQLSVFFFII